MALSSNLYALNVQRMEMILAQTTFPKVPRWPSDGNCLQGHPKPAFSKKVQRGDQEKFLKSRPKSSLRLKGLKALLCKWHYPLICTYLERTQRLQKCPNGQVMALFARSPKPAFSQKVQRGDQKKFFKNCPKSSPRWKGPTALWRKWHYPLICMLLKCKDWTRF